MPKALRTHWRILAFVVFVLGLSSLALAACGPKYEYPDYAVKDITRNCETEGRCDVAECVASNLQETVPWEEYYRFWYEHEGAGKWNDASAEWKRMNDKLNRLNQECQISTAGVSLGGSPRPSRATAEQGSWSYGWS